MSYEKHEHLDREHLEGMDTFELRYVRRQLCQDIDAITGQLEMAEAEAAENNVPPDPIWQAKARHARRCKQRDVEHIEEIMAERTRKAEAHARQRYAATFINVARRRLPPLLLEEIDLQARREMEKPAAAKEYDEQLKRRRKRLKAARQQAERDAEMASPSPPENKVDLHTSYVKAAEQVCAEAQEIVRLWSAGESIDVGYYDRLAAAVDAWEFQKV